MKRNWRKIQAHIDALPALPRTEIARALGVSAHCLLTWEKRKRVTLPPTLSGGSVPKNPATRETALRLRSENKTYREIGDEMGVSRERVRQYLHDVSAAGYLPRWSRTKWLAQAQALFDEGWLVTEVARALRVCASFICDAKRAGKLRYGGTWSQRQRQRMEQRDRMLLHLRAQGVSYEDIAAEYGWKSREVAYTQLVRARQRAGITRNRRNKT